MTTRLDSFYVQNEVTIHLSGSTERIYKRNNNERPVVSEQSPHTCAS